MRARGRPTRCSEGWRGSISRARATGSVGDRACPRLERDTKRRTSEPPFRVEDRIISHPGAVWTVAGGAVYESRLCGTQKHGGWFLPAAETRGATRRKRPEPVLG